MERLLRISFLFVLLSCLRIVNAQQIPDDLFQKAVAFVTQREGDASTKLKSLQAGDIHTLYQVAKSMNAVDPVTSVDIWHHLADDADHVLSQVALGFAYSEEDKPRAIAYFVQAGENGPHQAALYNAARLLAEVPDFPKTLAYMRAAATLDPEYSSPALTKTCRDSYDRLSQQIMQLSHLSLQDAADTFLYASLTDSPKPNSKEEKIWEKAMKAIQADDFKEANKRLTQLQSNEELSELQLHLLKLLQAYTEYAFSEDL